MDLITPGLLDEVGTPSGAANNNPLESSRTSESDLVTTSIQGPIVSGSAIATSQLGSGIRETDNKSTENQSLPDPLDYLFHLISQFELSDSIFSGIANLLNDLGKDYTMNFEMSDKLEEINQAVVCHNWAFRLTSRAHSDRPDILDNLGSSHLKRFMRLGDIADIDKAIEFHSQAALLILDDHEDKSTSLSNLGVSHLSRFEHLGDLADINSAIECQYQAVQLIPDGHADMPSRLSNLGNSHQRRFGRLGDLADIDRAIKCQYQAVLLTPDGHADMPSMLNNLGVSHQSRFRHLGDLADINSAIACKYQAVLLIPDVHADKTAMLGNLGNSHYIRFERLGDLADIDSAIACQYQAVQLTPDGHADMPSRLNNLGSSHQGRFERLGELADIDRAIACKYQAILLTPDGHVNKTGMLNNLGNSHQSRFEHLGDLADINSAIACQYQAVQLTPDGHADMPSRLNNLGISYQSRFKHLGDLADIDKAIKFQSQAALLIPDDHAARPGGLNYLGNSHLSRFERLGDLADIDRAIEYLSQAALLTHDGHASKPSMLNNLGISHLMRFDRLGCLADIEKAIEFNSQAVLLIPDGHADKPNIFNSLSTSYLRRYKYLGDLADIHRAISYQSQALFLTPGGHVGKPGRLNNLSTLHMKRFEHLGDLTDLHSAIENQYAAVRLSPDWATERHTILRNLGDLHLCQFTRLGDSADINKAMECLRMVALRPTGDSFTRFDASRSWAQLSALHDPPSTLSAYQRTMDLVPEVIWIGSTTNRRYEHTRSIGTIAVEAAAVAISRKEYGLALEWLEAGRSIVWGQTLQLRTQFESLFIVDFELAQSLRKVALALENASSRNLEPPAPLHDAYTLEAAAQTHRRLAEDYERLLIRARQIPGFRDFMRPKRVAELMPAAQSGPVVVVNVHASRCDALIMRQHTDQIIHVPLSDVSDNKIAGLLCKMQGLTSRGVAARRPYFPPQELEEPLESILSTLWHEIVKPVLAALGFTEKQPIDQLPHITWCTTGALALLPIHAAGCYDETDDNLFAYAISSYTPTLSALLPLSRSLELGTILAVSQEATLPATKGELAYIKRHARTLPHLQLANGEATAEAVLDAMDQYNSVHLACHASQNLSKPLESCFYLHDRNLSLADITKRSLKNKGLAFLSACQTATGDDKSPDEAIHLAAGMLVAGYPTVIATMWSIVDSDAPLVADLVYGELAKDGKLDDGKVARALHAAVGALRDRVGEKGFMRWVPYIHMGI